MPWILRHTASVLSTRSATALYVGAVLGPGVLLLPALAAEAAGPASIVAWGALLALSVPLAVAFAALGVRYPEAGGTAAYARAAFGRATGTVTGWWFLAAVLVGAPAVALIGGFYVAELLGTGRGAAVAAAGAMYGAVIVANLAGLHNSARLQLGLAGLLAALLLVAVVSALPESRSENWAPFAPEGVLAVGTAASLLMFSFIGWEAVSHLVGDLRDPRRQLPRAIAGALAVVVVLYLGLAVATIGVLGTAAPSATPLADLADAGLGSAGRTATAAVAAFLTMGTMNAYIAAAARLAGALAAERSAPAWLARTPRALGALALVGAALLVPLGTELIDEEALVRACSTLFVAVYLTATAAGVRLLTGIPRAAAAIALAAVIAVLAFSGAFLLVPLAVAALAVAAQRRVRDDRGDGEGDLAHDDVGRRVHRGSGRRDGLGVRVRV
jgi:amino acid efflux transporter